MKWKNDEVTILVELLKSGKTYEEISNFFGRNYGSIKCKCHSLNLKTEDYKFIKKHQIHYCLNCEKEITGYKLFCNSSCSASYNNQQRVKNERFCSYCSKKIDVGKYTKIYCSFTCRKNHTYEKYINNWKNGNENGQKGIKIKAISDHLRRYILEKFNYSCSACGWTGINQKSKKYVLQVDHIDGNSNNNNEDNLTLLCPNCHSLTPTYGGLNVGNGRSDRREYYMK